MTGHHHRHATVRGTFSVLTVSDTRTGESDSSGALIRTLLEEAGHRVHEHAIVPDEPDRVRRVVSDWIGNDAVDGVLVNGGTGISRRDRTHEALAALLDQRLDGFGELFRLLSYEEIGSAAMMSRAAGGIGSGKILFFMPGSTAAVRLAMERLVVPELGHLLSELGKR